jgi:hypothetical protein
MSSWKIQSFAKRRVRRRTLAAKMVLRKHYPLSHSLPHWRVRHANHRARKWARRSGSSRPERAIPLSFVAFWASPAGLAA